MEDMIRNLVESGRSRRYIADLLGISVPALKRKLHKHNIYYRPPASHFPSALSETQQKIMTACMLGDGCIHSSGRFRMNYR